MGTIVERKRKDGSTAYMAQIAVMRDGKSILRETKTFDRRPAATAWIRKREAELAKPGALESIKTVRRVVTLHDAVSRYISENGKVIGRTKTQVLNAIKNHDLAAKPCDAITTSDLFDYARDQAGGRKPQTVANYMAHLGAVYAIAETAWGYPLDEMVLKKAMKACRRLGYTAKSASRERRPTIDEMDRIMAHFERRSAHRDDSAPMHVICAFAIFSTRRLEEITRITWDDFDETHTRVLVRDMKSPGEKAGNDVWCDLDPTAVGIIKAMPKTDTRVFPYNPRSLSAAFTRACKILGIHDLHFHDLRHDGVSRLFELGRGIPQVAASSGHRSWMSLQRYTHIRERGDKYSGWQWVATYTAKG
jgi:integrase